MAPVPKAPPKLLADLFRGPVTLTAIGDSITSNVGTFPICSDRGYLTWIIQRGQGRFRYVEHCGAGGYTTTRIRNELLPLLITRQPKPLFVIVHCGANDISQGVPIATTLDNYDAIFKQIRAWGMIPVGTSNCPSGATAFHSRIAAQSSWMARYCAKHGYPFVDVHAVLADPDTGLWLNGYNGDLILGSGLHDDPTHPGPVGAKAFGNAVADALLSYLPPWTPPLVDNDADPTSGFAAPLFKAGFADANGDGLPDAVPPKAGFTFTQGQADATVSYITDAGCKGRMLQLEKIGNATNGGFLIDFGGAGVSGAPVTPGGVAEWGFKFKLENMGVGNTMYLWLAQSNASTNVAVYPFYANTQNIELSTFYAGVDIPATWLAATRMWINLSGPAGPRLALGQITIRDLPAFGVGSLP